ncbi:MAG TPA: hypothetical protein ENH94_10485 [Phycisphaerales bacterium]|nr:hypothetical protein [Phycisphaerales bacterium]
MSKNRNILTVLLVVIIVGLMVSPALAEREYRPSMAGPTRWISVSEPAYEGRDQSTQPVATVEQKSDLANTIDGAAEFVGDTAGTVGTAFGETVEATGEVGGGIIEGTGEVGGGILTWVGDVASAAGELVGGTWEFLFGGWGCPRES